MWKRKMVIDYIKSFSRILCVSPICILWTVGDVPVYLKNLIKYNRSTNSYSKFTIKLKYLFPVNSDRCMDTDYFNLKSCKEFCLIH